MPALDIQRDIDGVVTRDPQSRADRYFDCPICGERVDRENLDQMLHHDEQQHPPRG